MKGKTIPVDAESSTYVMPDDDGDGTFVLLDGTVTRAKEYGVACGYALLPGIRVGYKSHFATCPEADKFRKPRKSDRKRGVEG